VGRYLSEELQAMADRLGPEKVIESRGAGHLQALELPGKAGPIIDRCREQGVLVISAGENILRLAPPLTLTRKEAQEGLSVIEKALSES
jgi:acetylornithine/succinyldiaminopimelate/putrescine aminotransferase